MLFDLTLEYPSFRKNAISCLYQLNGNCWLSLSDSYLWILGKGEDTHSSDRLQVGNISLNAPSIIESYPYFSYCRKTSDMVSFTHSEDVETPVDMTKLMSSIIRQETTLRDKEIKYIRLYMDTNRKLQFELIPSNSLRERLRARLRERLRARLRERSR